MGPVILDLQSALADVSAISAEFGPAASAVPGDSVAESEIHVYSLARATSGAFVMGHVSHASHSSHTSGSSHYSHGSHSSHASHVSGGHSSHVSGSSSSGSSASSSPEGRPDLRIGTAHGALHGNNIYGSAAHQTVAQTGSAGKKLTWHISVQNDATVADHVRLKGAGSAHGFTVKYVGTNGADVTKAVEAGTFRTPRLARGASYRLTVTVKVTTEAKRGHALTGNVHASSALTPSRKDSVAFVAHRR